MGDCAHESQSVTTKETFVSFVHTSVSTAKGLPELVSNWLSDHGLDLHKIRGQGYDEVSVMSGEVGGMQKTLSGHYWNQSSWRRQSTPFVRAPFVHCASHNLNLVTNDAAEATIEGVTFFGTIDESFNFFGHSLNRWAELALTEDGMKKLKLKKLYKTRWSSSRTDAVRALKNRYADILKVLMRIILTSKHSDATALKKNMDNLYFVMRIIIWERILTSLLRVSQQLQATNTDFSASVRLLSAAYGELQYMRDSWDSVLMSANAMSLSWELNQNSQVNASGA